MTEDAGFFVKPSYFKIKKNIKHANRFPQPKKNKATEEKLEKELKILCYSNYDS